MSLIRAVVGAAILVGSICSANAAILIRVNKSAQKVVVFVDGEERYVWPASTGRVGHETPSGSFQTFRMEADHYSKEWDDAPMPYSIFFTKFGHAIHGTAATRWLGKPVSHGCVRISRTNAAKLYSLVAKEGLQNTKVVLFGETKSNGTAAAVAKKRTLENFVAKDNSDEPPEPHSYQRYFDPAKPPRPPFDPIWDDDLR